MCILPWSSLIAAGLKVPTASQSEKGGGEKMGFNGLRLRKDFLDVILIIRGKKNTPTTAIRANKIPIDKIKMEIDPVSMCKFVRSAKQNSILSRTYLPGVLYHFHRNSQEIFRGQRASPVQLSAYVWCHVG